MYHIKIVLSIFSDAFREFDKKKKEAPKVLKLVNRAPILLYRDFGQKKNLGMSTFPFCPLYLLHLLYL